MNYTPARGLRLRTRCHELRSALRQLVLVRRNARDLRFGVDATLARHFLAGRLRNGRIAPRGGGRRLDADATKSLSTGPPSGRTAGRTFFQAADPVSGNGA